MKKYLRIILATILSLWCAYGLDYLFCPAWNLHSGEFLFYLIIVFVVATIIFSIVLLAGNRKRMLEPAGPKGKKKKRQKNGAWKPILVLACVTGGLILFGILGAFASSKVFHAKAYSQILTVEDGDVSNIPSVEGAGAIALMDTASATKLGDREIGSLSNVVSQYNVREEDYAQINFGNSPVKVAPLSYAGIVKWKNNKSAGIPGYVSVNPVTMTAKYVALEKALKYVPSAYFGDNLTRHIRQHYRTVMFYEPHFEVDEEGKPWYIAPVYENTIGLYGGEKVTGAILVDPVSGDMQKMNLQDVPTWVDIVIPGDLICEQYNNYAQLQKGFFNSIFGQDGCRKVTESYTGGDEDEDAEEAIADYGYIAKNDDIYIYTGVTSVNGDSSNIGFIIANERTGETVFLSASGADEFSAMSAAEGEVQEKAYQASFPSLITVDDIPTYIMVLKDKSGLVKMYACVNVEQYNIVATSTKQEDCIKKYKALMAGDITSEQANEETTEVEESGQVDVSEYAEKKITVKKLQTIDKNGNTYLYVVDEKDNIYSARYADVIDMILVNVGDEITIQVKDGQYIYHK